MQYIPITLDEFGLEKTIMQCRTCGTAISTNMQQCPTCGSPVPTGRQQGQYVRASSTKTTTSSHPAQAQTRTIPSSISTKGLPGSAASSTITTPQSRRRRKPGLLAGMIVGILLVALIGAAFIVIPALMAPKTPSGSAIDPSAAAIITDIVTTTSVDPMTAAPGPITQTFKTYATVYVAFHLNLKNFDFTSHNAAYIQAKFYADKTYAYQRMLIFTHPAGGGFFAVQYNQATAGSVELYWCLKSDCSDGKLAQTTSFTITA